VFLGAKEGECGPFGSVEWYRNYSAVTGACMMMRREVYEALGGFDETYQLVFSDVDICLRAIEKGYRVMYTPFARLLHYGGKTRGRFNPRPDLWRAYQAFSSLLQQGDPYYNPNLSYARTYPRLRGAKEAAPIEALRRLFPMADS
jgi:GT2 family glycosyltransferase